MKKIQIDDCICHSKIKEHLEIRDSILSEIEKSSDGDLNKKILSIQIVFLNWIGIYLINLKDLG